MNHLSLLSSFHPISAPPSPTATRSSSPAASLHQQQVTRDREINPARAGQAVNAVHAIGILARQPLHHSSTSDSTSDSNEPLRLAQSALQRLVTAPTASDSLVIAGLGELALIAENLVLQSGEDKKVSKKVKEEFREVGRVIGAVGRGAVLNPSGGAGAITTTRNGDGSPEGSDGGMGKEEAVFRAVSFSARILRTLYTQLIEIYSIGCSSTRQAESNRSQTRIGTRRRFPFRSSHSICSPRNNRF